MYICDGICVGARDHRWMLFLIAIILYKSNSRNRGSTMASMLTCLPRGRCFVSSSFPVCNGSPVLVEWNIIFNYVSFSNSSNIFRDSRFKTATNAIKLGKLSNRRHFQCCYILKIVCHYNKVHIKSLNIDFFVYVFHYLCYVSCVVRLFNDCCLWTNHVIISMIATVRCECILLSCLPNGIIIHIFLPATCKGTQ